jgi:hypothetical protein
MGNSKIPRIRRYFPYLYSRLDLTLSLFSVIIKLTVNLM